MAISTGPARAAARVALVIGNSNYESVGKLTNPANDAALMGRTLRRLGFTLVDGKAQLNLDKDEFDRVAQEFGRIARGADVALFYYAGHGLQVDGRNYLVPVDANPESEADVGFQMVNAAAVLGQMEVSHARLKVMILDACRNNPFAERGLRSLQVGLAQMDAPEGTMIAFSTQPGHKALDGAGGDSPYTKALAGIVQKPGLDIFRTFNEVGIKVSEATNGRQRPWVSSSPIKGDFYFVPGAGKTSKPNAGATSDQASQLHEAMAEDRARLAKEIKAVQAAIARANRETAAAEAARKAAEKAAKNAAMRGQTATLAAKKAIVRANREGATAKAMQRAAEKKASEAIVHQQALQKSSTDDQTSTAPRLQAGHPASFKTAALSPAVENKELPTSQVLSDVDIAQLLKFHLREVGCDPGQSGSWDAKAEHALQEFNKHAGTHLDTNSPTLATLQAVQAAHGRICPLVCGRGTRREGDACIAITCASGSSLGADGKCHPNAKSSKRSRSHGHRTRHPASGGLVMGSPRHLQLRSACKSGDAEACRTLCSYGANRACWKLHRMSGLGGFGWGGGYGHHHHSR